MAVQLTLGVNRQVAAQPMENEADQLRRENNQLQVENTRLSSQVEDMRRQMQDTNAVFEQTLNAMRQQMAQERQEMLQEMQLRINAVTDTHQVQITTLNNRVAQLQGNNALLRQRQMGDSNLECLAGAVLGCLGGIITTTCAIFRCFFGSRN